MDVHQAGQIELQKIRSLFCTARVHGLAVGAIEDLKRRGGTLSYLVLLIALTQKSYFPDIPESVSPVSWASLHYCGQKLAHFATLVVRSGGEARA